MTRLISMCLLMFLFAPLLLGQDEEVWFEPNRGQWDSPILYKVGLKKGDLFIERDKFTYALSDLGDVYHLAHQGKEADEVKHHTIHSHFINSSWEGKAIETDTSVFYKNYFIGNDESKWQSKVRSYKALRFIDFYPGIDMILETTFEKIKYSFEIKAGVDPSIIQIYHEGMERLEVDENQVEIYTRFGSIIENELEVWNESTRKERSLVRSEFAIYQDTVTYFFPDGYDTTSTLIIDPSLTFSTFTGSTSDNWGFTAAPDDDANLYAGGIVFGTGYPISTGAYDGSFNGGFGFYEIDIGISKFSSDGSSLIYSTYLGGSGNETPNSIITNSLGELYVLGSSTSNDFPITASAYQSGFKGGDLTTQIAITFDGTDIIVAKLSADGSSLMASTFLGGSGNDGLNVSNLNYNYGDVFRGEIILDLNGDVVLTSSTQSTDFPIVNGFSNKLGGTQDAVVAKMSPDLTTLIWSTYLGGSNDDAGYSVQVSSLNNIYVSGGTRSTNMPMNGGYKTIYQGGAADGFLIQLDGTTSNVISGTYIGTNQYDQSFFVQIDMTDRVYVFGQTAGTMTISPGVYNNPNSGQFIQQYSSDLSTLNWSTIVGGGNGVVEISPTAFLVSNCNKIYYTGWGGQTNRTVQALGSTSLGFPTTANAYQSNTNGNNFYIGVLSEDAGALNYGTFMGGTSGSSNHVDGGTSRFDKHGRIYHAVCGACGGNSKGFTTTPGAYSETNNSTNCNLAAWKFDLGAIYSAVSIPRTLICLGDTTYFSNDSRNGDDYYWDFGDESTSTASEPSHIYTSAGIYDVMFVVSDFDECFDSDTSYLTVEVSVFNGAVVQPPGQICSGEIYHLQSSGGVDYKWSPSQFLDDPYISNPTATIDSTTIFTVIVSDSCGADTIAVTLEVIYNSSAVIDDLDICRGDTIPLWVSGGVGYDWTSSDPSSIIKSTDQDTLWVSPDFDANYMVEIYTAEGCTHTEQVNVFVFQDQSQPVVDDTVYVCEGDVAYLTVSSAPSIVWFPNIDINTVTGQSVIISTAIDRWYFIDFTNPCGTVRDSVFIKVIESNILVGNDTIVCPEKAVNLWASGGVGYEWEPAASVNSPSSAITTAAPYTPTVYTVYITDEFECVSMATVKIDHFPRPSVHASADFYNFVGDEVKLFSSGNSLGGSYTWSPSDFISCEDCQNTTASPRESAIYTVTFEDKNGCIAQDEIAINFEGIVYVPNSFTPDGNGINEFFYVVGGNIEEFQMLIFDRWGELIFESYDINGVWDGTYGNRICQDGTYIWKIVYEDTEGNKKELVGHVNLLR